MTGDHQMFYGDGRTSDPVPLDFLKARNAKFKSLSDEEKVESVLNHLATNLEAEVWFYGLDKVTRRKDWKLFEVAFETNWLRETVATVLLLEKRAKLTKEKLEAKEVLKLTMVNGVEMTGRAIWVGKVRRLSAHAKDKEGALIGVVYDNLPDILKKHMKSEFADGNEFIKDVQDVKELDIHQSLKEDDRIMALECQLSEQSQCHFSAPIPPPSRPMPMPTLPTASLRTMMSNFTISCPSAPTRSPLPAPQSNNPFLQRRPMSPTNLFTGHST